MLPSAHPVLQRLALVLHLSRATSFPLPIQFSFASSLQHSYMACVLRLWFLVHLAVSIAQSSANAPKLPCVANPQLTSVLEDSAACYPSPWEDRRCEACFVGNEAQELKATLGLTDEIRQQRKTQFPGAIEIGIANFLSAQLSSTVAGILLEEFMGYDVRYAPFVNASEAIAQLLCGNMTMIPEVWEYDQKAAQLGLTDVDVHRNQMGAFGESGLFIPKYMVEDTSCLFHYRAFQVPLGNQSCEGWVTSTGNCECVRGQWFVQSERVHVGSCCTEEV